MFVMGAYVLCEKPLILATLNQANSRTINEHAPRGGVVHVLRGLDWHAAPWLRVAKRVLEGRRYRNVRLHWMCNTEQECHRLRLAGQSAQHCHHNLYCLDTVYKPLDQVPKRWDAVYVGALVPYKRPNLACGVRRLRIVTHALPVYDRPEKYKCSHAVINDRWICRRDLAATLNEAHCGLALSAEEGGMFAATEYLLCGLPIVSTASRGGRDVWFTPHNHILVEPRPEAVAEAVRHVVDHPREPQHIRQEASKLLETFRQRYVHFINELAGRQVLTVADLFADHQCLLKRFVLGRNLPEMLASYDGKSLRARHLIGVDTLDPTE